jgi:putative ABC transport system substrate-binding protein
VRRALLAVILVAASSLVACGSDGKPDRTIAILRTVPIAKANEQAFLGELDKAGWSTGHNLTFLDPDPSEIHADPDDAAKTVRRWVRDDVDLIVALSTPSAMAASKEGGRDVKVLTLANDPVASGLLNDPDAPEGNLTGLAYRTPADRTIDIASRLADGIDTVGVLWPSDDLGAKPVREALVAAGRSLSVDVVDESFTGADDAGRAVDALAKAGAQVVIIVNSSATVRAYDSIAAALDRASLPSVANIVTATFATVVLAPDPIAAYRQLGRQGARLLGGAAVKDVPLEDPGEFHLTVRTERAAALGVRLSPDLVRQADEIDPSR